MYPGGGQLLQHGLACRANDISSVDCVAFDQKLYRVHSQFSKDLTLAVNNESAHTIADCFIMNKEKFLVYGEYCSNLLQAQDLLDHLCNTMPAVQSCVTVRGVRHSVVNSV